LPNIDHIITGQADIPVEWFCQFSDFCDGAQRREAGTFRREDEGTRYPKISGLLHIFRLQSVSDFM
jgi:hypothetical protein